ncbi:MAG: 50S ribosomal protein L2 [Nanoarchaeota archaeon]|nr:50S ribosomal protein L2 [Nanoarchaeota archaeon]
MGHNLLQQRRGRGTSIRFFAPSFRYFGKVKYRKYDDMEKNELVNGKIVNLVNCPGHSAPLMEVKYDDGETAILIAPENIFVNQLVSSGSKSEIKYGNTLPLKNIPADASVYCLEITPGDGGKLVRTPGTYARIVASTPEKISIKLPSGKIKDFSPECRATIGVIAGTGRKDKPFVKAGKKYHAMKAKNRVYPIVSPVKMNPIDHPFGCGRAKNMGRSAIPRRGAPPGAKVGLIRARRTGRRR